MFDFEFEFEFDFEFDFFVRRFSSASAQVSRIVKSNK